MNGTVNLIVTIPDSIKKSDIVTRELQVLIDGVVRQTVDMPDKGQTKIIGLHVQDTTTITLELRGIYATGAMAAPLVHEFIIVDGVPCPRSDIFDITIMKAI